MTTEDLLDDYSLYACSDEGVSLMIESSDMSWADLSDVTRNVFTPRIAATCVTVALN